MGGAASIDITASTHVHAWRPGSHSGPPRHRPNPPLVGTRLRHPHGFGAYPHRALVSPLHHRHTKVPPLRASGNDKEYPSTVRAPIPFPEAVGVGLAAAASGAKTALATPSDAWKPLTGAVAALALVLDVAGFYGISTVLGPAEDAGAIGRLFSELVVLTADGACLLLAPLVSLAIVQQVLPLLGEKIFFDGARAAVEAGEGGVEGGMGSSGEGTKTSEQGSSNESSKIQPSSNKMKLEIVDSLERGDGLGLKGITTAASRTSTLASLTASTVPLGAAVTFMPGLGPVLAAFLATTVASYALAWELLDPYFDKKELNFQAQDQIMWANRFALCAFAAPFTVALAVPLIGPAATAVAQGAAGTLMWAVLEPETGEGGGRGVSSTVSNTHML